MSKKWASVRHVPVREGENVELEADEYIHDVDWEHPMFHLIIVKVASRRPAGFMTNRVDDG
jgi:hypothetical protein